jgi:chemotaxis protein histidine kinase CheA
MAANETVGINLVADTKSLRGQLREAVQELAALQNKAGATGAEIGAAAKRAAELKDRIGDAKDTIAAFDPDAKFKAFGQSIQGVAGAFAATQGALALVGVESKEVEKQLLKVQGALALSEGLNTVLASIDGFRNLGLVLKTNVVAGFAAMKAAAITAFTTVRGALIATGVGAFAISLGLIIANFDAIKEAVLKAVPGLAEFGKIVGNLVEKITDYVGITNEAERALDKFTKTSERRKESLDGELKILEAAGASEKQLSDKRKEIINTDLNVLRLKLKTTGELSAEEYKKFRELKTDLVVIDTKFNKSIIDANSKKNEELAKQNQEAKDKADAKAKKDKEDADKKAEEEAKELQKNKDRIASEDEAIANRNADKFLTDQQKEEEAVQAKYTKQLEDRIKFGGDEQEIEEARNEELQKIRDKFDQQSLEKLSETTEETVQIIKKGEEQETKTLNANVVARKKLAEEEKKAKIDAAQGAADTLANLSNLLGQETAAGKAAAVASATISAILSAQKAYESTIGIPFVGPVLAPINAGLALASGYKSIQSILSVQVPGQAGGGSPSLPSAPDAGAGAPIAPRAAEPTATTLDSKSLNTISNVVSRAYVVESDITGSQQRISRIEKAARF